MRTAGLAEPDTSTSPIPSICESACCSTVEAASYRRAGEAVSEVTASTMIGESAGLTFL